MGYELRPARQGDLKQVDALLPSALNGTMNTIHVVASDEEVLAVGAMEAVPVGRDDGGLRIELSSTASEHAAALVDQLAGVARSWGAGAIECMPKLGIDSPEADQRRKLGFEPTNIVERWSADVPLQGIESNQPHAWETVTPDPSDSREVIDLFMKHRIRPTRLQTTVRRLFSQPRLASLSRVIKEQAAGTEDRSITGVMLARRRKERCVIHVVPGGTGPDALQRVESMMLDADSSWTDFGIKSLEFTGWREGGLQDAMSAIAGRSGATLIEQPARWVKSLP